MGATDELPMLQRFADYMQRGDTIGAEIGMYSIAGVAFAVAYWKTRPFSKFSKSSDIPRLFIQNRLKQTGDVASINPSANGPLLMVKHRPPLNLPFANHKRLPVKLYGVQIYQNGYSWLQTIAASNTVRFVPLLNSHDEFAECQVFLDNSSKELPILDLAACLTSLGFAQVTPIHKSLASDPDLVKYHVNLMHIQDRAKRNRNGVWANNTPTLARRLIQAVGSQTLNTIYTVFSWKRPLPELVR